MLHHHEYETIYIARPDMDDAEVKRFSEKFERIIAEYKGTMLVNEEWGRRKMAYPIKKHQMGHYTYLNYVGPSDLPAELERNLRIEDNLLRFLTILLAEDVEVEERRTLALDRQRKRAEKLAAMLQDDENDDLGDDDLGGRRDRDGGRDEVEDDE